MKKVFFLGLVVGLVILGASSSAQANMLTNADFEAGATGQFGFGGSVTDWTYYGQSGWHLTDYNHTPSGSKAIKTWWDDTGIYQDFSVSAGTSYAFGGYGRSDTAGQGWDGIMKIEWYNGATKLSEDEIGRVLGVTDPANTWKAVSGTFTAPVSADTGRFFMAVVNNDATWTKPRGAIGWDDVSANAVPVPEPTSMLLLGSGLVGLFTLARRNK